MRLAIDRQRFQEAALTTADEPERLLLADTARALEEVQRLLDRSRRRGSRFEGSNRPADADQGRLIAAQTDKIRLLERQVAQLEAVGADQVAALDEAMALVADLEDRMGFLEQVNAELQLLLVQAPGSGRLERPAAPDDADMNRDLDRLRAMGAGDDLTRFNAFSNSAEAA